MTLNLTITAENPDELFAAITEAGNRLKGAAQQGQGIPNPETPPAPVNPTYAPVGIPANGTGPVAPSANNTPAPAPTSSPPAGRMAPVGYPAAPTTAPTTPTGSQPGTPAPASAVPTAAPPTYDIATLSGAAAPLMAQGRQQDLRSLLASFGAQALTQLPPDRYGEFATALRGMGAKI